ncbi:MAG: hypothetical protein ACAI44_09015 [Candidatus Sericytochromatia bacterium]
MDPTQDLQAEARARGQRAFGEHRWDDAIAAFGEALALGEDADLLADLGAVHQRSWRLARASELYRQALALESGHVLALSRLASACQAMLQPELALTYRSRVLELVAERPCSREGVAAFGDYIFTATCLWPFAQVADAIRRLGPHHLPRSSREWQALPPGPERRIRLGYLSADFHQHSVMYLLEPLFIHSDRERFEIFCYYNGRKRDDITAWLERHTHFRSILAHTDKQADFLMRSDRLDLLVDLSGYSAGRRLSLLARKPAPRLATGLGFTRPLGFAGSDYALLDPWVFSDADAARVPETIVRIPGNLYYRPQPELELRAPGHQGLVFGSANNLYKLNGPVLDCWAEILRSVPGAVLRLKTRALSDPQVLEDVCRRFGERGIDPGRIQGSGQASRPEMMAWYHGVDICLDPFPYQGGITSCEALYMGCPVISLAAGGTNTTLSLLRATGLDTDICASEADYIARALTLASQIGAAPPEQRLARRHQIRERICRSPVFDPVRFVTGIEAAYEFICSQPGI